jgi:peptidoglycan/xylan/chitin deacetylase (PgdA/CDA1 family)
MTDVLVLCYHAVSRSWPSSMAVTADQLEQQLTSLVRHGYVGARFTDAVCRPRARRTLAVTFDDAFRSVLDHALPVLDRLGLPATVFVPTGFAEGGQAVAWPGVAEWATPAHGSELRTLDWDELGFLARHGWEIGSHTITHPRLTELEDAALDRELAWSRAAVEEELGLPCRSIAYPFGDLDARVAAQARRAGYAAGAALPRTPRGRDPMAFPRVGVYRRDDGRRFAFKSSRAARQLRAAVPATIGL